MRFFWLVHVGRSHPHDRGQLHRRPWGIISNGEGFRKECEIVKSIGGVGKWAVHPAQIEPATSLFGPSEEIDMAVRYIAMYEEAKAQGIGAVKPPSKVHMMTK